MARLNNFETLCLLLLFHCALCTDVFDGTFKTLSFHVHNGTSSVSALKYSSIDELNLSFDDTIFMKTINSLYVLRNDIINHNPSQDILTEVEHLTTTLKTFSSTTTTVIGGIDIEVQMKESENGICRHLPSCTLLAMLLDATSSSFESEVVRLTRVAAEGGHSDAQSNYANLIEQGRVHMKNEKTALKEVGKWRTRSSKQGNAEAQYMLGLTLLGGRGIKVDQAKAKQWLQQAAQQGHSYAQYELALVLEKEGDEEGAFLLMQSSASNHHLLATHNLAIRFHQGQGVSASEEEALKWFTVAAEAGFSLSAFTLGMLHEDMESNDVAAGWYLAAGELGEGQGYASLGSLYEIGAVVPPHVRDVWSESDGAQEACKWYRQGAEIGDAGSMFEVGRCISEGMEGGTPDQVEAKVWFELAKSRGYRHQQVE